MSVIWSGGVLSTLRGLWEAVMASSVLLALIGLSVVALAHRRSGATRHSLCLVTLSALLALPIAFLIPQSHDLSVPKLSSTLSGVIYSAQFQPAQQAINLAKPERTHASNLPSPSPSPSLTSSGDYTILDFLWAFYLLGIVVLIARQVVNQIRLSLLVAKAKEVPSGRKYPVLLSESVSIPIALWWKRPMIILPSSSCGWTELRTDASIEHEMAHIARGDLASAWLAVFTKILYWPNPLVWILTRQLTDAAESATDDRVLASGVAAPDYAEMLVQTAREKRSPLSPPVLAMARSSRVGRRVRAVLDSRRRRGGASLLATCGLGLFLVGLVVAMGRIQQRVALPTALSEDLRKGLTVPAQLSNGFVGEDVDGRKVTLLQVERWTPTGVETWKPDGTPLPASQAISDDWHRHDPNELHIYSRFDDPHNEIDPSGAGIGSGPYDSDDPSEEEFMGGYPLQSKSASKTIVSFLRVPHPSASLKSSITFGYSAVSGAPVWTVYPNERDRDNGHLDAVAKVALPEDFGKRMKLTYPAYGTPFVLGTNGDGVKDGKGGYLHKKILSTELTFTRLTSGLGTVGIQPVAYLKKNGEVVDHIWNDGHQRDSQYDFSYFWPVPPAEIDHIDVNEHRSFHVAYLHFALRPNGAPKP